MAGIKEKARRMLYDLSFTLDNRDYSSEIQFWDNHLARKDEFKEYLDKILDRERRKEVFPADLESTVAELKKSFPLENLRLLEVGSGPTSNLAWGVDQKLFLADAIDPLAGIYGRLMKKYGHDFPIMPRRGTGEDIDRLYDEGTFHIAYSQNAIDHASSPQLCISGMCRVLKTNGIMYLCGHVKEATSQHWFGLHQHDLEPVDGRFLDTDNKDSTVDILADLKLKQVYLYKAGDKPGDWYTVIYKKYGY